ncbi:MAG: hypothetical protein R2685_12085 [Candidatus Nitrosocosmicus sp.]|nr:hypothetical protein [Candidatus Nitrosocosmicus sp.]
MSISKRNTPNLILLSLIMISLLSSVFSFSGSNSISLDFTLASAQTSDSSPIQILSTSTFMDETGNFHIIGEVNNTSLQPQNNVVITAILSNATNNLVVGNHSAFTSINTLRTGELSPFDIVIQNPQQILGKFNFMEFIASSQPSAVEKPANLVLNGSSSFLDNSGNPHITGSIINEGQNPEQSFNLVATFYDNSSIGVIGTQTFGLNVGNLTQNQMAPFDITITDNKTKSDGVFYSLNVDSSQSSMSAPLNTKTSFASTGWSATSSDYGLYNGLPVNNPSLLANNNDDESSARDDDGHDVGNNNNNNDDDNGDDQRGEKKTDDQGNPWFDDENCSEKPGSSGGSSSECEEAEREEESEGDDEDSSEKDQGPSSNSDSDSTTNGDDGDENENDNGDDNNGDENTATNEDNGDERDNGEDSNN